MLAYSDFVITLNVFQQLKYKITFSPFVDVSDNRELQRQHWSIRIYTELSIYLPVYNHMLRLMIHLL